MIDKNGKLFGKINIIDLIVILLVVAMVAFFGISKISKKDTGEVTEESKITMEFATDEVYDYVVEHVKEGDALYDADFNKKIGTVKSFEAGPSRAYTTTSDGKLVMNEKEGFSSLTIVCDVEGGVLEDNGVDVDGTKYGVGHTLTIRAGLAKIYLKVSDIKVTE